METSTLPAASEAATTGSRETPLARSRRRIPTTPLKETEITGRMRLLIEYMVHGSPHRSISEKVNKKPGEPFTPEEAARLLHRQHRWARRLLQQPAMQRLLARETEAFRTGAKARAWRKVDELAHTPGDGSAAWAKVNHQAANTIIGEPKQAGPTINVQTNVGVSVKAGLVLRLPANAPQIPLEQETNDDANR